tara:strand:- start:315 stop:446 length:132 start_codon:yes stop_codon:yes gene_type:complete
MKKIILNIFLCLFVISILSFCGKKGDLKQPGGSEKYPKEYPNE